MISPPRVSEVLDPCSGDRLEDACLHRSRLFVGGSSELEHDGIDEVFEQLAAGHHAVAVCHVPECEYRRSADDGAVEVEECRGPGRRAVHDVATADDRSISRSAAPAVTAGSKPAALGRICLA